MKKTILIALSLFILASCGVKNEIKKDVEKKVEVIEKNEIISDDEVIDVLDTKIKFSDLEDNLAKLKDLDINNEDLRMLNEQMV
jgi:uncharacterized protein YcfL